MPSRTCSDIGHLPEGSIADVRAFRAAYP